MACTCSGRDVFSGPAAAVEAAKNVKPGRMELTAFSAYDTGDLIGLEGRSFIVKLPENSPPNLRVYPNFQWYVSGKPMAKPKYYKGWRDTYVERTRCWLVDIGFLRNRFSKRMIAETFACLRFKGLDAGGQGGMSLEMLLAPPRKFRPKARPRFFFWQAPDRDVLPATDIPIGVWFVWGDKVKEADPLKVARAASVACVFYVRFEGPTPAAK